MSKSDGTLADAIIRQFSTRKYRQLIDFDGWVPNHVALARKFSLDDEMSSFMADLAYASMPNGGVVSSLDDFVGKPLAPKGSPRRVNEWVDSMRLMSRLPHDLTWIEYDMKKRAARSRDEYGQALAQYSGPQRCGWLIRKIPQGHLSIDSVPIVTDVPEEPTSGSQYVYDQDVFEAIPCSSQSLDHEDWTIAKLIDVPNAGPLSYIWTTGEKPLPNYQWLAKSDFIISRALVGIECYRSSHVSMGRPQFVTNNPEMMKHIDEMDYTVWFREQSCDLRYLWAFLATINDLPIVKTVVKPDKGHMVRGNYKRFSEHTVITLKVPGRASLSTIAKRALRASRRRAHQVRGHWRIDWRSAPASLCDHAWVQDDDKHIRCKHCRGRKTWLAEHQRGDASIGFVLHDYSVQRGEPR